MRTSVEPVDREDVDFVATGAADIEPLHFHWRLDNDTLKDINRAIGFNNTQHGRGFLGRLMLLWLEVDEAERPRFEVPEMRTDDLIFVPSPCYIVGLSDDGTELACWYTVLVDAEPGELLDGNRGVWVFRAVGNTEVLARYLDCIVKTFRLRVKQKVDGYTFYRMI